MESSTNVALSAKNATDIVSIDVSALRRGSIQDSSFGDGLKRITNIGAAEGSVSLPSGESDFLRPKSYSAGCSNSYIGGFQSVYSAAGILFCNSSESLKQFLPLDAFFCPDKSVGTYL
jgi:hypothetical protein